MFSVTAFHTCEAGGFQLLSSRIPPLSVLPVTARVRSLHHVHLFCGQPFLLSEGRSVGQSNECAGFNESPISSICVPFYARSGSMTDRVRHGEL
jgi:hypothetical protein